jgi:hypothetical protein
MRTWGFCCRRECAQPRKSLKKPWSSQCWIAQRLPGADRQPRVLPTLVVQAGYSAVPRAGRSGWRSRRSAPEQGTGPDCARRTGADRTCSHPPCLRVSAAIVTAGDSWWLLLSEVDRRVSQRKQGLAGCMQLVGYFNEQYPGLHFERGIVEGLAKYALSVDFDFYYLYSNEREDT